MSVAMFSVAVTLDEPEGADPKWTATCDRCGQEIAIDDTSQVVFKVKGFDQAAMRDPRMAQDFADRLRKMYAARQPMIVDAGMDIQTIGRGFDDVLLTHARMCKG